MKGLWTDIAPLYRCTRLTIFLTMGATITKKGICANVGTMRPTLLLCDQNAFHARQDQKELQDLRGHKCWKSAKSHLSEKREKNSADFGDVLVKKGNIWLVQQKCVRVCEDFVSVKKKKGVNMKNENGMSVKKKSVSVKKKKGMSVKKKKGVSVKKKERRERKENQRLSNRFREHDRVSAIWIDKKAYNATVHEVTNEDIVQVIFDGFEEHGPWHAPSGDV